MFMLGLSKRMKEMCTSAMLTLEMAEFSSVELGSMTTSTYLHSTCNRKRTVWRRADDCIER